MQKFCRNSEWWKILANELVGEMLGHVIEPLWTIYQHVHTTKNSTPFLMCLACKYICIFRNKTYIVHHA